MDDGTNVGDLEGGIDGVVVGMAVIGEEEGVVVGLDDCTNVGDLEGGIDGIVVGVAEEGKRWQFCRISARL